MNNIHFYIFENYDKQRTIEYQMKALMDYALLIGYHQDLKIIHQKGGKPILDSRAFCFSITHSHQLYCVACHSSPIGTDIEYQKVRHYDAIAKRFFHPLERQYCQHSDFGFFDVWCYKEAMVKCCGCGIDDNFSKWSVTDGKSLLLKRGAYSYIELHLKPQYTGCIVCKQPQDICYHWM